MTETYRAIVNPGDLKAFKIKIEESDILILAKRDILKKAEDILLNIRAQLKNYIKHHPDFLYSLVPIKPDKNSPEIIKRMCEASEMAEVGPMASVAGAIAEMLGENLLQDSEEIIVENGGDIFLNIHSSKKVLIFAGDSPLSQKLAVKIEAGRWGIATSSGKIGHSLNFGKADSATVIAESAAVADAFATSLGNKVSKKEDIEKALEWISQFKEKAKIIGAIIILDKYAGFWGNVKIERP